MPSTPRSRNATKRLRRRRLQRPPRGFRACSGGALRRVSSPRGGWREGGSGWREESRMPGSTLRSAFRLGGELCYLTRCQRSDHAMVDSACTFTGRGGEGRGEERASVCIQMQHAHAHPPTHPTTLASNDSHATQQRAFERSPAGRLLRRKRLLVALLAGKMKGDDCRSAVAACVARPHPPAGYPRTAGSRASPRVRIQRARSPQLSSYLRNLSPVERLIATNPRKGVSECSRGPTRALPVSYHEC